MKQVSLIQPFHRYKYAQNAYPAFFYCLLIAFLAVPCFGQEIEIESVIPAYSVACATVENVSGIWSAIEESSSWKSFSVLNDVLAEMDVFVDDIPELVGVDLQTLMGVFGSKMAFVQVYMDIVDSPPLAIVTDVGDPESAVEVMQRIEQALGNNEEYKIQAPAGVYQESSFSTISRRNGEIEARYALLDNLFVLTFEQDTFEAIIDVYAGEDPPIIYDPKFNNTSARISIDGEVFAYANMEILWPALRRTRNSDLAILSQILGLDEVKSVAWTTNLLDASRDQEIYMYTGGSDTLITSLMAEHGKLFSPHLIPVANSDIFLAMNLGDLTVAWNGFWESMRVVIGEEEYADSQIAIAEFEQRTATDIRDDLLSSLTGEIGIAMPVASLMNIADGPEQMVEYGLMLFCGVIDREQCAMSIERMLSVFEIYIQPAEYNGTKIYYVPTPNPTGYTFIEDMLIFGNIQSLESVIAEEPPVIVSEEFAEIASRLPQRPGLMYYVNMTKIGELLLMANPEIQPDDYMIRLKAMGSTGGTLLYDGEGLKGKSVGTPDQSWFEALDALAQILFRALL